MRTLVKLVAVGAVLAGCGHDRDLGDVELPRPFALVGGVTPGTTLFDLRRQRPAARFAPYVGYEEQVGGLTFRYYVDGTESRQTGSLNRTRIDAVEAVAKHGGRDEATAAWANAFREYQARMRGKPECYVITGTIANNGPVSLWKEGGAYVVLRAVSGYAGTPRNPRPSSPLLIWRVGTGGLPPVMRAPGTTQVDCATLTVDPRRT